MTIVSLAVLVRVSAPLRQFLRVRSILSIPISAQSVVLVQVYVLLRPSACPNYQGLTENRRGCFIWSIPSLSCVYPFLISFSHKCRRAYSCTYTVCVVGILHLLFLSRPPSSLVGLHGNRLRQNQPSCLKGSACDLSSSRV